jgi:ATP-dependent exoDNAse (exonuclease V) alpha subunit
VCPIQHGLFNGAVGTVVDIIYGRDKTPNDSLPYVIMVEFSSYTGPAFLKDYPRRLPIVPVERRLDCFCHFCKRKQMPLRLGWASTIHRCQGITVGEGEPNRYIIINPGTRTFEAHTPGSL